MAFAAAATAAAANARAGRIAEKGGHELRRLLSAAVAGGLFLAGTPAIAGWAEYVEVSARYMPADVAFPAAQTVDTSTSWEPWRIPAEAVPDGATPDGSDTDGITSITSPPRQVEPPIYTDQGGGFTTRERQRFRVRVTDPESGVPIAGLPARLSFEPCFRGNSADYRWSVRPRPALDYRHMAADRQPIRRTEMNRCDVVYVFPFSGDYSATAEYRPYLGRNEWMDWQPTDEHLITVLPNPTHVPPDERGWVERNPGKTAGIVTSIGLGVVGVWLRSRSGL